MREIKFRAWDKKYKEILFNVQDRQSFTEYHYEETGEYLGFHNIVNNDNFILLQYTGLKDKNGVDIYEGDICKTINGKKFKVKYLPPMFMVWYFEAGEEDIILLHETDKFEIIGNIYNNPELINQ